MKILKPRNGKYMINIIPKIKKEETYMFPFENHYKIGVDEKIYAYPKPILGLEDRRCPICKYIAEREQRW